MQPIVNNKVSSLEVYSNTNKAAHAAADSTKASGSNKDSKILREISDIIMDNTSDLHSKVESLRGLLSSQGYDIDSQSAGTKNINKALDEIANLHSNMAAKNKKSLVGKDELSHLHNEISKRLDVIKYSIRDNSIATLHQLAKSKSVISPASKDSHNLTTGTSYAELWAVIATSIGDIKTNYLDYYSGLLQKYEEVYEDYNNNVQKASSEAVTKGSDSNSVSFSTSTMKAGYTGFDSDVANIHLDPVPGWKDMSSDQKNATISSLQPAFNVDSSGNVTFNLEQYNNLSAGATFQGKMSQAQLDSLGIDANFISTLHGPNSQDPGTVNDYLYDFSNKTPDQVKQQLTDILNGYTFQSHTGDSPVVESDIALINNAISKLNIMFNSAYPAGVDKNGNVSTPSYQAWLATFNACGSTLQSNMNSFTQRYSQANSTFDNLNKVLSGTISSLSDAAKDVFKSL